jgi:hypothetical protein
MSSVSVFTETIWLFYRGKQPMKNYFAWGICFTVQMLLVVAIPSTATADGKMALQGSDDPLLFINHTGTTGNPAIWFQQDGANKAFLWWDRVNSRLNLGTPAVNPIVSLQNDGSRLEILAQDGLSIAGF